MTTAATSLLGLALPVTGELQGTWGDTVNNSITSLLDTAVAGTTTLSTDLDVTLTTTTLAANQARQAILLCSGARTAIRTITAPAQSKIYTIINATTGGYAVKIVGVGPTTGISIPAGQTATVAWNGSDFVDASNYVNGNKVINGNLTVNGNTTLGDANTDTLVVNAKVNANLLFTDNTYDIGASGANRPRTLYLGTSLISPAITNSGLTSGRVVYSTTGGAQTDSANLLYSGTDLTVYGITVGRGAGAVSTNTAVGSGALVNNSTGSQNTGIGYQAGYTITTGTNNTAVGASIMDQSAGVTGTENLAVGRVNMRPMTSGSYNTAAGNAALNALTTGSNNSAFGFSALAANTTASNNTAVGYQALYSNATSNYSTAVGHQAGYSNTASEITAIGYQALYLCTTAYNVAVGGEAGRNTTSGARNTFLGTAVAYSNTSGGYNAVVGNYDDAGASTLATNTSGSYNSVLGVGAMKANTTGSYNTAVGYQAGYSNTANNFSVYLGHQAGNLATGSNLVALGVLSGQNATGTQNTFVGNYAGSGVTSGAYNTFIGQSTVAGGNGAGYLVTTGSKNVIIGGYSGNQGGLDIRTASNYIVLSDGDGKPMAFCKDSGGWEFGGQGGTQDGLVAAIGKEASNYGPVFIGRTGSTALSSATSRWYIGSDSWVKGGTDYDALTIASGAAASGGVKLTSGATSWVSASDARLKTVTGSYDNALSDIAQIQAVKFTWKHDAENKPCVGVIAQSVQPVVPEAIDHVRNGKDDDTEYLGVRYTELIPLMIASIQELKADLDATKAELAALKGA